jgi:hypothetical protein
MTQQAVIPWTFYVGDGVQTTFAYPWRIGAASDLEVYLADVLTTAYTVTGVGSATGGNVVFFNAPPVGQIVFLRRVTPQTQETDYVAGDPFGAEAHEAALDKLTRMVQDLYERIARSPAFAVSAANVLRNLVFPGPEPLKLIGWSASGTALTLFDRALTTVTVSPGTGEVHGVSTVEVPSVGGAEFLTAVALIPAGVKLMGVGYRVVTSLSTENSLVSVDVGGPGIRGGWGSALGITKDSVNNVGQMRADMPNYATAGSVVITPNPPGALFGAAGLIRLTAFWLTLTPL